MLKKEIFELRASTWMNWLVLISDFVDSPRYITASERFEKLNK